MPPIGDKHLKDLDPQYVEFYNKYMADGPAEHSVERLRETMKQPATVDPVKVASVDDYHVNDEVTVRVWTPLGEKPKNGWPVFMYLHGGGFCGGGLYSEAAHLTIWAERAKCVVVSVGYRLAPEHKFPTAFNDAVDGYRWVVNNQSKLQSNGKIAIGGSSAGANMTANISHYINLHPEENLPKPVLQLFTVPSFDMVTEDTPVIERLKDVPGMSLEDKHWFNSNYQPDREQWKSPWISPMFHDEKSFRNQPPSAFVVGGMDLCYGDAEEYAEKLKKYGNKVTFFKKYEGSVHIFMIISRFLDKGKEAVDDIAVVLKEALNP